MTRLFDKLDELPLFKPYFSLVEYSQMPSAQRFISSQPVTRQAASGSSLIASIQDSSQLLDQLLVKRAK